MLWHVTDAIFPFEVYRSSYKPPKGVPEAVRFFSVPLQQSKQISVNFTVK